jgi:hypothetical protein
MIAWAMSLIAIVSSFPASKLDVEGGAEFSLQVASGIFALILFVVTVYAWKKRGSQRSLLIVSLGFLAFFAKQLVEILPLSDWHSDLFLSAMDFLTLGLFFVALVVRPQRRNQVSLKEAETKA